MPGARLKVMDLGNYNIWLELGSLGSLQQPGAAAARWSLNHEMLLEARELQEFRGV